MKVMSIVGSGAEAVGDKEGLVQSCKESAVNGMELFLKIFSFVPNDKLDWTPVPSARSALSIAAHTAIYPANFAQMIRERKLPMGEEIKRFQERTAAAEKAITSRGEMERAFRQNTEIVVAALDTLGPEDVALTLESSLGWSMPMRFLMELPGRHAITHAAQIDYLQTCWGDHEVHF